MNLGAVRKHGWLWQDGLAGRRRTHDDGLAAQGARSFAVGRSLIEKRGHSEGRASAGMGGTRGMPPGDAGTSGPKFRSISILAPLSIDLHLWLCPSGNAGSCERKLKSVLQNFSRFSAAPHCRFGISRDAVEQGPGFDQVRALAGCEARIHGFGEPALTADAAVIEKSLPG